LIGFIIFDPKGKFTSDKYPKDTCVPLYLKYPLEWEKLLIPFKYYKNTKINAGMRKVSIMKQYNYNLETILCRLKEVALLVL
jgi:hypothetical protein